MKTGLCWLIGIVLVISGLIELDKHQVYYDETFVCQQHVTSTDRSGIIIYYHVLLLDSTNGNTKDIEGSLDEYLSYKDGKSYTIQVWKWDWE